MLYSVQYANSQPQSGNFYAFDGNGNVAALINAADGTVTANYEYAAFGEPVRLTGAMAKSNPFRFSTKYADDESDLLYYGYRYYKPSTGTWPSRDQVGERYEINLYQFANNSSLQFLDLLGMSPIAALGPNAGALLGGPNITPVPLIDPVKLEAWKMLAYLV